MLIMDTALNPILRPTRPAENTKADVTDLRETLLRLNVWPEAGDEFLALLPVSVSYTHLTLPTSDLV